MTQTRKLEMLMEIQCRALKMDVPEPGKRGLVKVDNIDLLALMLEYIKEKDEDNFNRVSTAVNIMDNSGVCLHGITQYIQATFQQVIWNEIEVVEKEIEELKRMAK